MGEAWLSFSEDLSVDYIYVFIVHLDIWRPILSKPLSLFLLRRLYVCTCMPEKTFGPKSLPRSLMICELEFVHRIVSTVVSHRLG